MYPSQVHLWLPLLSTSMFNHETIFVSFELWLKFETSVILKLHRFNMEDPHGTIKKNNVLAYSCLPCSHRIHVNSI
jgi:hypothetical protein